MHTKSISAGLVVLFGLISGFSLSAAEKTAPISRPSPTLKLDSSPVNDGKSSLVTSYAEVIEPAQTAVVSVYS
ncbi:MAG TPA: protease Do, partial [Opitutus sp.]|nr:protease Do [Opitutus sp.]